MTSKDGAGGKREGERERDRRERFLTEEEKEEEEVVTRGDCGGSRGDGEGRGGLEV